jgi:subtilisin family serine protease
MLQGWGTPATYIECFEFFLAPYPVGGTPAEGDPDWAPHVINNSWGCPPNEGCGAEAIALMEQAVAALRQAGIVVVVSAGNYGPSCGTVYYPPAIYPQSLTVGAFGHQDGNDVIAGFSSRGPVSYGGQVHIKPDVAAPGVTIYSSTPGGTYGWSSGTSMAAPHVAGAVALLLSAVPGYAGNAKAIEGTLTQSAQPQTTSEGCGTDGPTDVPNNVWGWGVLDVLAAIGDEPAGILEGTVRNQDNGQPLPWARLVANVVGVPSVQPATHANSLGYYVLSLPAGTYQVTAKAVCHAAETVTGTLVISGSVTVQDFALDSVPCTYLPLAVREGTAP